MTSRIQKTYYCPRKNTIVCYRRSIIRRLFWPLLAIAVVCVMMMLAGCDDKPEFESGFRHDAKPIFPSEDGETVIEIYDISMFMPHEIVRSNSPSEINLRNFTGKIIVYPAIEVAK